MEEDILVSFDVGMLIEDSVSLEDIESLSCSGLAKFLLAMHLIYTGVNLNTELDSLSLIQRFSTGGLCLNSSWEVQKAVCDYKRLT